MTFQLQSPGNFTSAFGDQVAGRVTSTMSSIENQNLCSDGFDLENLLNGEWSIGGPALTGDAVPRHAAEK
jgi:hypothetical protein